VFLLEPVDYASLVWLLDRCELVLTDSGGIQEEAPALGKPLPPKGSQLQAALAGRGGARDSHAKQRALRQQRERRYAEAGEQH
jgi:hypothetical protein